MNIDILTLLPFGLLFVIWVGFWGVMRRRQHPRSPEQLEAARLMGDLKWLPSGWAALAFALVYLAVSWVLGTFQVPGILTTAALSGSALAFIGFMVLFIREARRSDELAQRVRSDALSFAFGSFLCFAMGMWVMNELWPSPRRGWFEMGPAFLPMFYFVGLLGAKARWMPTARSES